MDNDGHKYYIYDNDEYQFNQNEFFDDSMPLRSTDRLLPIANIAKLMKRPIPKSAKVAKDAKEMMQKAASEFIAVITCCAKDLCDAEGRKTLSGEDLIGAMDQLGMKFYGSLAKTYLKRFKESAKFNLKQRSSIENNWMRDHDVRKMHR